MFQITEITLASATDVNGKKIYFYFSVILQFKTCTNPHYKLRASLKFAYAIEISPCKTLSQILQYDKYFHESSGSFYLSPIFTDLQRVTFTLLTSLTTPSEPSYIFFLLFFKLTLVILIDQIESTQLFVSVKKTDLRHERTIPG